MSTVCSIIILLSLVLTHTRDKDGDFSDKDACPFLSFSRIRVFFKSLKDGNGINNQRSSSISLAKMEVDKLVIVLFITS